MEREVALLSPIIDTTIQRLKDLQSYRLTYGELVKVLDAMDKFYDGRGEGEIKRKWCDEICLETTHLRYAEYREYISQMVSCGGANRYVARQGPNQIVSNKIMKIDVKEKMDMYQRLSGAPHPRWDEFNKM